MKTIIIKYVAAVLVLFLSLSASFTIAAGIAKEKKAKITFTELKHDFGKVEEGVELTYTFKFKNTGRGELVIENVRPSCGCTGATVGDKTEYKKNENGEIKISFNTRGREGVQSKTITVQTNDPDNPQIVLSFTCEITGKN